MKNIELFWLVKLFLAGKFVEFISLWQVSQENNFRHRADTKEREKTGRSDRRLKERERAERGGHQTTSLGMQETHFPFHSTHAARILLFLSISRILASRTAETSNATQPKRNQNKLNQM